ncbi:MAG: zinc ribbon domain-containing protein [Alphaproteobacteria bacterium]|nr:zinc ribbon domain-containing protein [Alphaproteobacteria bacterium]MBQ6787665.1 zinc ribbon domain-containing protein [Lachnospiraceae bacterium]
MMMCVKCGTKLPNNAKFCINCGEEIVVCNDAKNVYTLGNENNVDSVDIRSMKELEQEEKKASLLEKSHIGEKMNKIQRKKTELTIVLLLVSIVFLMLPWGLFQVEFRRNYFSSSGNIKGIDMMLESHLSYSIEYKMQAETLIDIVGQVIDFSGRVRDMGDFDYDVWVGHYLWEPIDILCYGLGVFGFIIAIFLGKSICVMKIAKEKTCRVLSVVTFLLSLALYIYVGTEKIVPWDVEFSVVPYLYLLMELCVLISIFIKCKNKRRDR